MWSTACACMACMACMAHRYGTTTLWCYFWLTAGKQVQPDANEHLDYMHVRCREQALRQRCAKSRGRPAGRRVEGERGEGVGEG